MVNADRDNDGKFAPGNKLAVGHAAPHARKVRRLYHELIRSVTVEDIRDIARSLITMAKSGNVRAVSELFDRLFGRAVQFIETDFGDEKKSVWFSFAPPTPKVPAMVSEQEPSGEVGQAPAPQQSENSPTKDVLGPH